MKRVLWSGDRKEFDAGSYGQYFSKVLNAKQSHAQSAHYLVCQKKLTLKTFYKNVLKSANT